MQHPVTASGELRTSLRGRPWLWVAFLMVAQTGFGIVGCQRAHYRTKADDQAYQLIDEKLNHPHWALPKTSIEIDPRSRMYDPFDPDRPPMPPDDPFSHELMHFVDGKKGYRKWHADGDTQDVENPGWLQCLPVNEDGVLELDLEGAMELALLHSPVYQQQLETLYLSALDVSAERFRFDTQLFAGYGADYRTSGVDSGRPRSRLAAGTTRLSSGRSVGSVGNAQASANRFFASGADALVGVANSLVWDFNGADSSSAMSLLNFSFIQPLLREAGRDQVLARLTLAERQLLANVRQMDRYRRGFYMDLSTGRGVVQGPRRIGGLFGGSGLEGFTGVGGGFGGVGGVFNVGPNQASAALQAGGFLGLLQVQQSIINQQANISGLRSNLIQFQETLQENLRQIPEDPTEIVRNRLQLAQTRQQLYQAEFTLLTLQTLYQTTLDDFKMDLGLPPHISVRIIDPMLNRFNLIDPEIAQLQDQLNVLRVEIGTINEDLLESVEYETVGDSRVGAIAWTERLASQLARLKEYLEGVDRAREKLVTVQLQRAQADIERLQEVLPQRRATVERLANKYAHDLNAREQLEIEGQTRLPVDVDPAIFDDRRLESLPGELKAEHLRLSKELKAFQESLTKAAAAVDELLQADPKPDPKALHKQLEQDVLVKIPSLISELASDMIDISLVQARARADAIDLEQVDLPMDEALRIAGSNRRDWMNARASLVDTWRSIAFVANSLEGFLNLVVDGDLSTVGDNPAKFRSTTGSLRFGLQFDAPITRLLERNTYRQVLIDYQRARRNYYTFIDTVSQTLRTTIRTLDRDQLNFESRRLAVLSAIEQVVLNDEIQTLNEERALAQGVTAARDAVQALLDLQRAQDDFMGVWVTYEVNRRQLDFNLGTMQLNERGAWVDPGSIMSGYAAETVNVTNPAEVLLAPDDVLDLESAKIDIAPRASKAATSEELPPRPRITTALVRPRSS